MKRLLVLAIFCLHLTAQTPQPAPLGAPVAGAIVLSSCNGAINNLATIVLYPLQNVSSSCNSATGFTGPLMPQGTIRNLMVRVSTASNTPGSGVVTVYKTGVLQPLTCTLGLLASCGDMINTFTTAAPVFGNTDTDVVTVKVTSAGGTLTGGPTYSSGLSACTNGTQVVTFTNGTSGVAPVNALGTITVSGNVPTGAVTVTNAGAGYTAATPPTTGTVATCTGTGTFTGGTVTVDTLASLYATFQVYP